MDKYEIVNYIKVGKNKSICIDRRLVDNYPGFVRDIIIMSDIIVKVEFNIYDYDEGGLSIKIFYHDFDQLIRAIEDYINVRIKNWVNISKTDWYPTLDRDVDLDKSALKIKQDLVSKTLALPLGGIKYEIPEGYWKDLLDGKISL